MEERGTKPRTAAFSAAALPSKDCIEKPHMRRTLLPLTVENAPVSKLSFEDALAQLEAIVESMEAGEVPLADLLAKFEEGNKLLKVCEGRLKEAELKIEQLKKQKDGSVAFAPFESDR